MRKIFTYLAVAALVAVACDDMYGPVETPTRPDHAIGVRIQVDTIGDDTLAFTLAPVGEVSYYSYMVAKGPAQDLDSTSVYQCKLDAMIKGTFNAAEDSLATLTLGELAPNTPYTIYAVAGSLQGIPTTVFDVEVVTTDRITIKCADFEAISDSSVVLTFTEKVFLGEGKVTATYYAANLDFAEMGTVEAVADSILVEGNTVTVQFAGLPHGAHWAVSYPKGTFVDSANNKIAALNSGFNPEAEDLFVGVYARRDTVAFDLDATLPEEQQLFNDWESAMFTVGTPVDSTLAAYGKAKAVVKYVTPGKVLTIDLVPQQTYMFGQGQEGSMVAMVCPEQPAFGTEVVFSYPQDAFQDIWGNPTKAAEYATLCAYDYTIDDVLGTYNYVVTSAYTGADTEGVIAIEASDDEEKGNVMFTTMWDYECETNVYATFNPITGVLTIPSKQQYATGQTYNSGFATFDGSGSVIDDPAELKLVQSGVMEFNAETYYIGDAAIDPASGTYLGFFDLYYYLGAQVTATPVATATPATKMVRTSL